MRCGSHEGVTSCFSVNREKALRKGGNNPAIFRFPYPASYRERRTRRMVLDFVLDRLLRREFGTIVRT